MTNKTSKSEKKSNLAVKKQKTKTVKIKHHHHKPYRKRHISGLVLFVVIALLLMAFVWQYSVNVQRSLQDAQDYIVNLYPNDDKGANTAEQPVSSTYGFSLTFDKKKFYATAIDAATGNLFLGSELETNRAYKLIRFSPPWIEGNENSPSMSVQYYDEVAVNQDNSDLATLEADLISDALSTEDLVIAKSETTPTEIAGQPFIKTTWQRQYQSKLSAEFNSSFVTYTGVINGQPLIVTIDRGLTGDSSTDKQFDSIFNSLNFGARTQARVVPSQVLAASEDLSKKVLNSLTMTKAAYAEDGKPEISYSEKNSAFYGPAVIKIFNVYCMDITLDGKVFLGNICDASSGTGFFVSEDGFIATNGHVASSSPKDIAIKDVFVYLAKGDSQAFDILAEKAGLTLADIQKTKDRDEQVQIIIDKLYEIPDSSFAATNNVNNLLVSLNEQQPDIRELLTLTAKRKSYAEQDTIKQAKFISADYRIVDGVKAFRASDVAFIKIEGSKFPTSKLGSISSATQGSSLSILGYPGIAGDNGLTETKESKVTLTSGKVSSVKNALGSEKQLIETDATIGHGNSGGPALTDSGEVVGIATYTIDGSGSGDGVFNYIRDIQDLKDLAVSSSVTLAKEPSETQKEWEQGLDFFYRARYSKSLKNFEKVQGAYPQHPKVAEFITTAQERISKGEDVKDFPVVVLGIAAVVIAGIAVVVVMIVRHKKAHNVYKANVNTGAMQPLAPGAPAQQISYNPAQVAAANNLSAVLIQPTQQGAYTAQSSQTFTPPQPQPQVVVAPQTQTQQVAPQQSPSYPQQPTVNNNQQPGGVIAPNDNQRQQ